MSSGSHSIAERSPSTEAFFERYTVTGEIPPMAALRPRPINQQQWFPGPTNRLGYRGDEFEDRRDFNVAYLGCSWVEGHGVARGDLFSDKVSALALTGHGLRTTGWNIGVSAASIDHVSAMLPRVLELMSPDLVVIVVTELDRREVVRPDGSRLNFLGHLADRDFVESRGIGVSATDLPMIEGCAALSNSFSDIAYFLRSFGLWQALLKATDTPLLFTNIDQPAVDEPIAELLRRKLLPSASFLGRPFERVDQASPSDGHPGPQSHHRFAEALVDRMVELELFDTIGSSKSSSSKAIASPGRGPLARLRSMLRGNRRSTGLRNRKRHDAGDPDVYPFW